MAVSAAGGYEGWKQRGWVLFICPDGCDSEMGPPPWRFWCRLCGTEGVIREGKKDSDDRS